MLQEENGKIEAGFKYLLLFHTWSVKLFVTQIFTKFKRDAGLGGGASLTWKVSEAKIAQP